MKTIYTTALIFISLVGLRAQLSSLRGQLQEPDHSGVFYANVALYNASDSTLVKVEVSDEAGIFKFSEINPGT